MKNNITEVTCIGQAVVDCITRGIDHDYKKGNVHRAETIALNIGGDAVNEATVLARLGHKVRLVCGLGDDIAGHIIINQMRGMGVDLSLADVSKDRATPIANLLINEDSSRESYNSDATMLGSYTPINDVTLGTRIVSFASLFRAPLDQADTVKRLITAAKAGGAIVCADTKLPTFRQMNLSELKEVLPLIDYIFPNDAEAAYFTGKEDIQEAAAYFLDCGVKNVIIKAGKEGCYASGTGGTFHMKALPVKAIDGTGAGDNFAAGFMSALLRGYDLYDCCRYGTVCAAACVENVGASGGVQSREEADEVFEGIIAAR